KAEEEKKSSGFALVASLRTDESAKKPRERKDRADLETILLFFQDLHLPKGDAEWFFHKCEGNGWRNGNSPIKDWRSTVRAWKAGGFMPSQKRQQMMPVNGTPKKPEFRDV